MTRLPAALLAFALAGAMPAAQDPDSTASPRWLTGLSSYLEAVNTHRPGTIDMPARFTGSLGEEDLNEVRDDFFALVRLCARALGRPARPASIAYRNTTIPLPELRKRMGLTDDEAAKGNTNRILVRAAILHADVAILVVPLLPRGAGCHGRATLLVKDGNIVGDGCLSFHWTHGRLLLDAVSTGSGQGPGRPAVVRGRDHLHARKGRLCEREPPHRARPPALSGRSRHPVRSRLLSRGVRVAAQCRRPRWSRESRMARRKSGPR